MRKIIFFYVFVAGLFISLSAHSQIYLGEHIDIKSYSGIWKYETPSDTLIIKLKDTVARSMANSSVYLDEILGTYRYIKNGAVVIDNMDMFPCKNELRMPMLANPIKMDEVGNLIMLSVSFEDTKTGKTSSDCYIEYISGGQGGKPRIKLVLKDETDLIIWENFGQGVDPEYDEHMRKKRIPGWSIPNGILLTKQD